MNLMKTRFHKPAGSQDKEVLFDEIKVVNFGGHQMDVQIVWSKCFDKYMICRDCMWRIRHVCILSLNPPFVSGRSDSIVHMTSTSCACRVQMHFQCLAVRHVVTCFPLLVTLVWGEARLLADVPKEDRHLPGQLVAGHIRVLAVFFRLTTLKP